MWGIVPPPQEHVCIGQQPHSRPFPIFKLLLGHGIEIGRDPDTSLRSTRHARLALQKGNKPNQRLTIAGDHDILAGKRSFDHAGSELFACSISTISVISIWSLANLEGKDPAWLRYRQP